MGNEG